MFIRWSYDFAQLFPRAYFASTHMSKVILGIFSTFLASFIIICLFIKFLLKRTKVSGKIDLNSLHILITGGSKGIGKALALDLASRGSKVTITARGKKELDQCLSQLRQVAPSKKNVQAEILDVTWPCDTIKSTIEKVSQNFGDVDILINCAGFSSPETIEDMDPDTMLNLYDTNVAGVARLTKCVIGSMKKNNFGQIVLISSVAGQFGFYGFSSYSSSKFALRGFAEALSMEVKFHNIGVTVVFPPDTDTPGFAQENTVKPEITKLISSYGKIFKPEEVSRCVIRGIENREYYVTVGFDGFLTGIITEGCGPPSSLLKSLVSLFFSGPLRLVFLCYLSLFYNIVDDDKIRSIKSEKS